MKKLTVLLLALSLLSCMVLSGCKNTKTASSVSSADASTSLTSSVVSSSETTASTAAGAATSSSSSAAASSAATTKASATAKTQTPSVTTAPQGGTPSALTITSSGKAGISTNASTSSADPYLLSKFSSIAASEVTPTAKSDERTFTSDKSWYIDTGVKMSSDGFTVSCKDSAAAINTQQFLGSTWKVSGSFRPIKTYDTRDKRSPVCTRVGVYDVSQTEVFMLTVNYMDKGADDGSNQVSVTLQSQSGGSWRTLCSTDDWVSTGSTVFYAEISYNGSLSCKVIGNNGSIFEKTAPKLPTITTLAPKACAAGFGVYAACSNFFYWHIESGASSSVVFPKAK